MTEMQKQLDAVHNYITQMLADIHSEVAEQVQTDELGKNQSDTDIAVSYSAMSKTSKQLGNAFLGVLTGSIGCTSIIQHAGTIEPERVAEAETQNERIQEYKQALHDIVNLIP